MRHLVELAAAAVVLFISTDIDDVFVLIGLFADVRFKVRQIVIGQFLGIALLYGLGLVGASISLLVPAAVVGLLGLVPIAIGLRKALALRRGADSSEQSPAVDPGSPMSRSHVATVFALTVANGGDNLSVCVPLFAMRSAADLAVIGIVFAFMTAGWLAIAYWLTWHRVFGAPLRRAARTLMPFLLIALGLFILNAAGTATLLGSLTNP